MKTFLLSLATAALLCGCPDTKVPKKPPSVPEPKAVGQPITQSTVPIFSHLRGGLA
jgi:hypothetical protein